MYKSIKAALASVLLLSGLVANTPVQAVDANPTFTWQSPAAGAEVSGEVTFKASAVASGTSYINKWCAKVDGLPLTGSAPDVYVAYSGSYISTNDLYQRGWFDSETHCWSRSYSPGLQNGAFKLDTTGWSNGSHNVQVTVTDSNSRSTTSTELTFTTNNPNPTFTWELPEVGAEVDGNIIFKASSSTSGTSHPEKWCLKVDGMSYHASEYVAYSGADRSTNDLYQRGSYYYSGGCWYSPSAPGLRRGAFIIHRSNLTDDAAYWNTDIGHQLEVTVIDSNDRTTTSSLVLHALPNGKVVRGGGASGKSEVPGPAVLLGAKAPNSIQISWNAPNAGAQTITGYRIFSTSNLGETWTHFDVNSTETSHTITGLGAAVSRRIQVAAILNNGEVSAKSEVLLGVTKGSRPMRIQVDDVNGKPVIGGSITWRMTDGSAKSVRNFGLTSDGVIDFPRAPAGWASISLSGGVLADGSKVSASWTVSLGGNIHSLDLPELGQWSHVVNVSLENGLPVSNVSVSSRAPWELEDTENVGGVTHWISSTRSSGYTNSSGNFTILGFGLESGAKIEYADDEISQNQDLEISEPITRATLEYVPWISVAATSVSGNVGTALPITLAVEDVVNAPNARLAKIGKNAMFDNSLQGVKVTLKGSGAFNGANCGAKGAKANLSGVTGSNGKVTLKVCAKKSQPFSLVSNGAAAVGEVQVRVKGAPSTPVTSVTSRSNAVGQIRSSWNAPAYLGGATILQYKVVATASGAPTVTKINAATVNKSGAVTKAAATSMTLTGLANAKTYTVKIYAITKFGTSDPVTIIVPVA